MKTTGKHGRVSGWMTAGLATGALALGVAGCKSKSTAAPVVGPDGQDPAAANMAAPYTGGTAGGYGNGAANQTAATSRTPSGTTKVLSSSQSFADQASGQDYSDAYGQQAAAPIIRQAPAGAYPAQGGYDQGTYGQGAYNQGYSDAEEAGEQALAETDQAPPPLPEYDQPPAPEPDDQWTPGYWNYASAGYYWVPGAWVAPPFFGALWTPSYWGFYSGHYLFHRGYWGPHVGFYGGINYGFGYIGTGYYGGYWRGHDFFYNRAVTNVNPGNIHNVYDRTVVFNNRTYGPHPENRVDFDGGRGGLDARPNAAELGAMREAHYAPVAAQRENRLQAASSRGQFFQADGGHPATAFAAHALGTRQAIAATPREQPFNHPSGVVGGANGFRGGAAEAGHGIQPGFQAGAVADRGVAGNLRSGVEAGHLPGAGAEHTGTENRNNGFASTTRPGPEPARNAPGGVAGGPGRVPQSAGGFRGAPEQQVPSQRGVQLQQRGVQLQQREAQPQRQAEVERQAPASRNAAGVSAQHGDFQRPGSGGERVAPVQRQAPAARPEPVPVQRAEPTPLRAQPMPERAEPAPRPEPMQQRPVPQPEGQRPAPAPHAAPAAAPHGGGEHGEHH